MNTLNPLSNHSWILGKHQGVKSLHVHFYKDGDRNGGFKYLYPGDDLYDRHKKLFIGVPIPDERK